MKYSANWLFGFLIGLKYETITDMANKIPQFQKYSEIIIKNTQKTFRSFQEWPHNFFMYIINK
jgi:hypothetical protein